MEKRAILAAVLMAALLIVYQTFFLPTAPTPDATKDKASQVATPPAPAPGGRRPRVRVRSPHSRGERDGGAANGHHQSAVVDAHGLEGRDRAIPRAASFRGHAVDRRARRAHGCARSGRRPRGGWQVG